MIEIIVLIIEVAIFVYAIYISTDISYKIEKLIDLIKEPFIEEVTEKEYNKMLKEYNKNNQ
jgi:hypothetical protein